MLCNAAAKIFLNDIYDSFYCLGLDGDGLVLKLVMIISIVKHVYFDLNEIAVSSSSMHLLQATFFEMML